VELVTLSDRQMVLIVKRPRRINCEDMYILSQLLLSVRVRMCVCLLSVNEREECGKKCKSHSKDDVL
jgi:hypothetical protein